MSVRLYIPEALESIGVIPWFTTPSEDMLFRSIGRTVFFEREVECMPPDRAQAILLPNNFKSTSSLAEAYITRYADLGEKHHIPVFIFSFGDFTDHLHFDARVWVFRLSTYRSVIGSRDIIVSTFAEDHGRERIIVSEKRLKPLVSFCGMGGFSSLSRWIKYYLKTFLLDIRSLVDVHAQARKLGIYWRRAMMRACNRSTLVDTLFIIRRSFSSLRQTIEGDPQVMRREFIENIVNADFVLAPKGDGNYSNRFMETLSLGRIPVLVDTEVVLPLESEIDYSKIIVRVPMDKVAETPRLIRDFYDALTEEEWHQRQLLARETFEQYLQQDAFFRHFFANGFPRKF